MASKNSFVEHSYAYMDARLTDVEILYFKLSCFNGAFDLDLSEIECR